MFRNLAVAELADDLDLGCLAHGCSAGRNFCAVECPAFGRVPPYVGASPHAIGIAPRSLVRTIRRMQPRKLIWVAGLALAACSSEPEPLPATPAVPLDRPLDAAATSDRVSVRTAALLEAALVQVGAVELRRCMADFAGDAQPRFAPPAHGGWLIVASALPADGAAFTARNEAAPELNPKPSDDWQDRVHLSGAAALGEPERWLGGLPVLRVRLRRRAPDLPPRLRAGHLPARRPRRAEPGRRGGVALSGLNRRGAPCPRRPAPRHSRSRSA